MHTSQYAILVGLVCGCGTSSSHGEVAAPRWSETAPLEHHEAPPGETAEPCQFGTPSPNARPATIEAIGSAPEVYDGQRVRIAGLGHFIIESVAIGNAKDLAFWITPASKAELASLAPCHRRWVIVEGVFNRTETGHWGAYDGGLEQINYVGIDFRKK